MPAIGSDGRAEYQEFPDAYVRRGLANEGLGHWEAAVQVPPGGGEGAKRVKV